MPKLIKDGPQGWHLQTAEAVLDWREAEDWQQGQPLRLDGEAEPDAAYVDASAIAIEFPAFNDGRGLSLAVLLRTRYGYTGELRATGAVHEDIMHYMSRCGFDAFELPDERNAQTALALMEPYSGLYQGSVSQPEPAFRRVNRGL